MFDIEKYGKIFSINCKYIQIFYCHSHYELFYLTIVMFIGFYKKMTINCYELACHKKDLLGKDCNYDLSATSRVKKGTIMQMLEILLIFM